MSCLKYLMLCVYFLLSSLSVIAQDASPEKNKLDWLKDHSIQLRSVQPSDEDFSDLLPFKDLLKDVHLVMLGEESHGDGTTFLAKTRLIKFLHQQADFNVLVFESGFYDCSKAWQSFNSGEDLKSVFRRSVWGLWSKSQQLEDLISYIDQAHSSARPLIFAGLDPGFIDSTYGELLLKELRAKIDLKDFEQNKYEDVSEFLDTFLPIIGQVKRASPEEINKLASTAKELIKYIETRSNLSKSEKSYWAHVMESIAVTLIFNTIDWRNPDRKLTGLRDEQMAENLISLMLDIYPDQKFIVWAASPHIARDLNKVEFQDSAAAKIFHRKTMGDYLWKEFNEKMYSVGFTAYEGEFGAWSIKPQKLSIPSPNSLEELMYRAGLNNAFIDFRDIDVGGEWIKEKQVSRPFGYAEMSASWPGIIDGIIFTKIMTPSTKSNN